jgi:hypothetical protein
MLPLNALPAADVHLVFHMGAGAGNDFVIGGTIENKGDESVAGGFAVILPVDEKCFPGKPEVASFGEILPKEKKEFRIPFKDIKLHGYRLVSFVAYDNMGYPVASEDETRSIIMSREKEERKRCHSLRG